MADMYTKTVKFYDDLLAKRGKTFLFINFTLKAPIPTAADELEVFFLIFQRK